MERIAASGGRADAGILKSANQCTTGSPRSLHNSSHAKKCHKIARKTVSLKIPRIYEGWKAACPGECEKELYRAQLRPRSTAFDVGYELLCRFQCRGFLGRSRTWAFAFARWRVGGIGHPGPASYELAAIPRRRRPRPQLFPPFHGRISNHRQYLPLSFSF